MKLGSLTLGLLLLAVGVIWVLQGLGILPGSFMTGEAVWGWIGAVCVVAGAGLLYLGFRDRLQS